MATIGRANLPVPDGADAPLGPAALAELALAIDGHLPRPVADKAERDAQYADAPQRTMVVSAAGAVWIKTSSSTNTWATVYEPLPAWRPITLVDGLSVTGGYTPQYRIVGRQVHVRGRVEKTDGTPWVGSGAKIADTPPDAVPARLGVWAGGQSLTGDPSTAVCRVECATSIVWWSQDGSGGMWVDISGSYWLD